MKKRRFDTGLKDKNGTSIRVGDKVLLYLPSGELRVFKVVYKTTIREFLALPGFDGLSVKVAVTGIVFEWKGHDLFPCVDEHGIPDTDRMVVHRAIKSSKA